MRRRFFKSSSPVAMITSNAYDNNRVVAVTERPTRTSQTVNTIYIYPVFGMPLTNIIELDESYRSRAAQTEHSVVDLNICEPEEVDQMPILVLNCLSFISQYGMEEEGLFRISAAQIAVDTLKQRIMQAGPCVPLSPDEVDVNAVANVLKAFLRDTFQYLPSVRLRQSMSSYTLDDTASSDGDFIALARQCLKDMPTTQYLLLKTLCRFFSRVAFLQAVNRMSARNIASIFSPSLNIPIDILELFIDNHDLVWGSSNNSNWSGAKKSSYAPISSVDILFSDHNKVHNRLYQPGYFQQMNELLASRDITDHFATKNISWD